MTTTRTSSLGERLPVLRQISWPRLVRAVLLKQGSQKDEERKNTGLLPWFRQRWLELSLSWRQNATPATQVEVEAEGGSEDIWSAEAEAEQGHCPEHLVIMVNGLNGSPADWKFAAEQIVKRFPDKVIVHRSECNTAKVTYDGVDRMGERLAQEVRSVVAKRRGVRKISFVAHSLGGLIARYAIAVLYEPGTENEEACEESGARLDGERRAKGRIGGLEPINFITSATPHLGSRGNKQLPFLFGLPFLERTAVGTAHILVGRTGKHLFLTDNEDGKPPLLLQMVNDCDDLKFISALRAFKRRVAYANANYDHIVGWRTASLRRQHELPKRSMRARDEKYPNVLNVDNGNSENQQKVESTAITQTDPLEEEMIRGLTQVPWERVDVSIQKSKLRYNAHYTIQVRSNWWNSGGADVIFHMIDNFLV